MDTLALWPVLENAHRDANMIMSLYRQTNRKRKIDPQLNLRNRAGFEKENGKYYFDLWGAYAYMSHAYRIPAEDGFIGFNEFNEDHNTHRKIRMLEWLRNNKKEEAWLEGQGLNPSKLHQVPDDVKLQLKGIIAFRARPKIKDLVPKLPVAIAYMKYWGL